MDDSTLPETEAASATWDAWNELYALGVRWLSAQENPPDGDYSAHGDRLLRLAVSAFEGSVVDYQHDQMLAGFGPPPDRGFWLYRLWGERGRLLYVGITANPRARLAKHRRTYGNLITRATWEECDDRKDMLAREAAAIASEHPAFNVQHPEERR